MPLLFSAFGALGLTALVVFSAGLLLAACDLNLRWLPDSLRHCPSAEAESNALRLAALADDNGRLLDQILGLERRLGAMQCTAVPPEPPREDVQLTPPPPLPLPEPEVAPEEWNERDVAMLEGCWDLDSVFSTVNKRTGEPVAYDSWTICYDAAGIGREEMRASNGTTCEGAVQSRFDTAGLLRIEQPGNLQCSDGTFIYRLSSACALGEDGIVSCEVRQPEVGSKTKVDFHRSTRNE